MDTTENTGNTTVKMPLALDALRTILADAGQAANAAALDYAARYYAGQDGGACGFAWVVITEHNGTRITGNTKMGRLLKAAGVEQDWRRRFHIWNPAGVGHQSVDTKLAGAQVASVWLRRAGFTAHAESRLD